MNQFDVDTQIGKLNEGILRNDLTVTGTTTLNGPLVLGDAASDGLTVNATVTQSAPVNYSNATAITAGSTQSQTGATALTEEMNDVTTCATAGDGVKLPTAVAGLHVHVKNSGATALAIYPNTSDSINALAVNLPIRIQPGSSIDFYAKNATVWESEYDTSLTIPAATTARGGLEIKAADSAGNTITTITNASQAAARTYTIPDAGTNASFVMTEVAQTINGDKTFSGATVLAETTITGKNGTAAGAGLLSTGAGAPTVKVYQEAGQIVTVIKCDLTGLAAKNDDNDVIGLAAGGVAYLTRITTAVNGLIFRTEVTCTELPTAASNTMTDIDLASNSSAAAVYDTDGAAYTMLITAGGAWAAYMTKEAGLAAATQPVADDYLYLLSGAAPGGDSTFTGGQFVIKLYGYALMTP